MVDASSPLMVFHSRGNIELLSQTKLAIFTSRTTPEELFPSAISLFKKLVQLPICMAGGWQSKLEKMLLQFINTKTPANLIQYYAREINELSLSSLQQNLLTENKLLIIAPETTSKRPSKQLVAKRDALLFGHCKKILFFYIRPNGRLHAYFDQLQQSDHEIFLFEHPFNSSFYFSDTVLLNSDNFESLLITGK